MDPIIEGILGTVTLWGISATLAIALALGLAAGVTRATGVTRLLIRAAIDLTRGVPTSILVLAAGFASLYVSPTSDLPLLFPGTAPAFQHLAWSVSLALALGSSGHLAEIFLAARSSISHIRIEQMFALGLTPLRRIALVMRECAAVALPPTGSRLVHHLHNTAYAALFPVCDLFGVLQGEVNATFKVFQLAFLGCGVYVALSGLIWLLVRLGEAWLRPPQAQASPQEVSP